MKHGSTARRAVTGHGVIASDGVHEMPRSFSLLSVCPSYSSSDVAFSNIIFPDSFLQVSLLFISDDLRVSGRPAASLTCHRRHFFT